MEPWVPQTPTERFLRPSNPSSRAPLRGWEAAWGREEQSPPSLPREIEEALWVASGLVMELAVTRTCAAAFWGSGELAV